MGLFRRLGSGLSGTTHTLHSPRPDLIGKIGYRIASSPHGLPMVELDLEAATIGGAVANPEMTLAVLIDRSGSMTETFAEGHVYDVASAILNAVSTTGAGFDLAFYDTGPTLAEHVGAMGELRQLVDMNRPRGGGTCLTPTLRGAIERYHSRRGIYLIVITDGEFADKAEVQHYIVGTLLPQLTPENPYAFRLHFVGAGEEVDREFLRQLEADAIGQGIQLVKHHHHAHLRHSHTDILSELDGAYLGISEQLTLGQIVGPGEVPAVTRVGDLATKRWHDGHLADIGFVPRRARLPPSPDRRPPARLPVPPRPRCPRQSTASTCPGTTRHPRRMPPRRSRRASGRHWPRGSPRYGRRRSPARRRTWGCSGVGGSPPWPDSDWPSCGGPARTAQPSPATSRPMRRRCCGATATVRWSS